MAVVLTSATKPGAGACNHRNTLVTIDGARTVTLQVTLSELDEPLTDDEMRATLKAWARYHRSRGVAVATLIGKTIFAEIAP